MFIVVHAVTCCLFVVVIKAWGAVDYHNAVIIGKERGEEEKVG